MWSVIVDTVYKSLMIAMMLKAMFSLNSLEKNTAFDADIARNVYTADIKETYLNACIAGIDIERLAPTEQNSAVFSTNNPSYRCNELLSNHTGYIQKGLYRLGRRKCEHEKEIRCGSR